MYQFLLTYQGNKRQNRVLRHFLVMSQESRVNPDLAKSSNCEIVKL